MREHHAHDRLDEGQIRLHRHRSAYVTISKTASYLELAAGGQVNITPGTAVLHPRFHLHSDMIFKSGEVWNVDLGLQDFGDWNAFKSSDIESMASGNSAPTRDEILGAIEEADQLEMKSQPNWLTDFIELNVSQFDLAQSEFSREYAHRRFKRHFGMTPGEYRRERQLQAAINLIESGHALASAAVEAGFSDQSHMTRVFKHSLGVTPGDFRSEVTPVQ